MKSFLKKSVALILLSVILGGFFLFSASETVFAAHLKTDYPTNLTTDSSVSQDLAISNVQKNLINEKLNLENIIENRVEAGGPPVTVEERARLNALEKAYRDIDAQIKGAAGRQEFITGLWETPGYVASKIAGGIAAGVAFTVQSVVIYVLELTIIPVVSFYLAVAGKILNFAVQYTIYDGFGNFYETIKSVWALTRDAFNVTFIFILLYIAITQIIGYTSVDTKKMLRSVIIAAIFINFSLFISRVVIDGGNMVANAFLNQIELTADPAIGIFQRLDETLGTQNKIRLSERIIGKLGLFSFLEAGTSLPSISTQQAINSFIKFILFLVTAFMFTFMALLLIGRFVMLIFLMAVSPIGFMGGVLPKLDQASKDWRSSLINQTLVAPVFMFFMLLIIKLAGNLPKASGLNMVSYFNYIFILFLIFKAISITKSFSGKIGGFADQIASTGTGAILGAATGGSSLLLKQTLGRAGASIASSDALKAAAAKSGGVGMASRLALRTSIGASKANFDVRGAPGAQKTLGLIKSEGGINISGDYGKSVKGNFVADKEAYAKAQAEFAKNLKRDDEATKDEAEHEVRNEQISEREGQFKKTRDAIIAARSKTWDGVISSTAKLEGAKISNDPAKIKLAEDELKKRKEEQAAEEVKLKAREKQADVELNKKVQEDKNKFEERVKNKQKELISKYEKEYAGVVEKSMLTGEATGAEVATKVYNKTLGNVLGKIEMSKTTSFGKAAADAIRKQTKTESDEQKFAKLAKKMAKEDADREAKEKKESEGEKKEEKSEDKKEEKQEEKAKTS